MIRTLITLVAHDLAVAVKNKTIVLLVCIPFFVYGTLMLVDRSDAGKSPARLGLLATEPYDPALRKHLGNARDVFVISEVSDMEEGTGLLNDLNLDGLLVPATDSPRVVLHVLKKESMASIAIVQRFAALQLAVQGNGASWISDVRPLQSASIEARSLPTWILMVALLVGFLVIPAQVAEEKEKQWLLGLLQTPMREGEWLAAKLVYGMSLTLAAVFALHILAQCSCLHWNYLAMLGAGSFCFSAMGIALGLLCRTQASARTFGVICYLPLIVPAALSDVSQQLRSVATFLPSHAFYHPIQAILMESGVSSRFPVEFAVLVLIGGAASLLSLRLIRVRWLF